VGGGVMTVTGRADTLFEMRLLTQMVWQCPALLRVEPAGLQVRWAGSGVLNGTSSGSTRGALHGALIVSIGCADTYGVAVPGAARGLQVR
jgi:hypothetical protein